MNSEPYSLTYRTIGFSKKVIAFCKAEKQTAVTRPLFDQLLRSATSIGANYAEANNASSKLDFRNKIFLAKKEAAEAKYWLQIIHGEVDDNAQCDILMKECHSLLMTLQKIINTMTSRKQITENLSKTVN